MPFIEKWKPKVGDIVALQAGAVCANDLGEFVFPQEFKVLGIDRRSGLITVEDEATGLTCRTNSASLLPVSAPRVLPQKPAKENI